MLSGKYKTRHGPAIRKGFMLLRINDDPFEAGLTWIYAD